MSSTRKKKDSKVQARLGFTPVSQDSTQAQELSPSVRARASAVRYHSVKKANNNVEYSSLRSSRSAGSGPRQQRLELHSIRSNRSTRLAHSDGTLENGDRIVLSQRRSSPIRSKNLPDSSVHRDHSSDEHELHVSEDYKKRQRDAIPRSSPPRMNDEDTDDSDIHLPPIGSRGRPQVLDDENDDDDDQDDEEDEEPIVTSSARASKRSLDKSGQQDYEQSSSPTKKRRLLSGTRPRKMTREELDEEILQDAEDLQDTTTFNEGLQSSNKVNEKKLARKRQLEKLLRRRNKAVTDASPSPSPEPEDHIPYNGGYSDEDSSEADSLIDDEELPDDFSETSEILINRNIYSVPSALYYVIRHILYQKFLPGSPETESNGFYTAAHSLISKRLESYRNQFISSVWRKPFTAALYARPKLTWPTNVIALWESCEACGRRDRPASWVISFQGSCYDEWTLKTVPDPESQTWSKFNTIVPEDQVWHVGADCHDNAWRAHRSAHWRHGLAIQIDKALGMMNVEIPTNMEAIEDNEEDDDLGREDRCQAVLLQMEEQGYIEILQHEFMERFEMEDEDDDE